MSSSPSETFVQVMQNLLAEGAIEFAVRIDCESLDK